MELLWTLFISFIQVGLFSVGGGYAAIPLIQEQVVHTHKLLTMAEFTDLITIAEMTPGPISINSATFVGQRVYGTLGAVLCTIGVILPAFIICLTLAYFYYKYKNFSGVQTVLGALRPAVVALIASAGMSILVLALFNTDFNNVVLSEFRWIEFILFIGGFIALRKYKLNAVTVILGTGVVGTLLQLVINTI
ncbi:chromate transporter [Tissierella pigra]|uniref:Chromate transporter n=1 Tax=Tissierella pigra TaxID=2607614 RepID=A0A6N7XVZ1_9FIRM|nr:chromate transporter [Tissierella pigra]MBU5425348.1 chromate transporter [Tissierella pigra]MSU00468.1 chromate transporter [Tissierella pigra]